MSEKIKNKAIEISDEEMNQISGGQAAYLTTRSYGKELFVQLCNGGQSAVEFYGCLSMNHTCGEFKRNEDMTGPDSCTVCLKYRPITMPTSTRSLNEAWDYYKSMGFNVVAGTR